MNKPVSLEDKLLFAVENQVKFDASFVEGERLQTLDSITAKLNEFYEKNNSDIRSQVTSRFPSMSPTDVDWIVQQFEAMKPKA